VLDAWLLSECFFSNGDLMTLCCQAISPDWRLRHSKTRSCVSGSALTVKTLSPKTIGDACPRPGNSLFQTTLLVAVQWTGTFFSALVPSNLGPRHCGQFSAGMGSTLARRTTGISFMRRNFADYQDFMEDWNSASASSRLLNADGQRHSHTNE
jgi:hypothetical protein